LLKEKFGRRKTKMFTQKGITITLFFFTFICFTAILTRYTNSVEMPTPLVDCVKTSQPPVIDGKLTDASWRYSGKIEKFIWANGIDEPYYPTEAFLLWDDDNFYLAVKCYESQMDKIKISKTGRDGKVWEDDVVEIFIDPTPDTPKYYHLAVNPIGTLFDQEASQKPPKYMEWDSDSQIATSITGDFWLIEMAIPLFDLVAEPPEVGSEWKFNLHRKEQRREEYTYWSPTYDRNYTWPHVPERFGTLRLSEQPLEKQASTISEETLKILNITVKGNKVVSAEEIIDIFGLKMGDIFDMDKVAKGIESLEATGWFKSIKADTSKTENGAEIIIEAIEKELVSVDNVRIIGLSRQSRDAENQANILFFSPDKLARYFGLYHKIMAVEDIDVKCRLIEQLYSHQNYIVLAIKNFENNTLVIKIDVQEKGSGFPSPPSPPTPPAFGVNKPRPGNMDFGQRIHPIPHLRLSAGSDTGNVLAFNRVRGLTLGSGIEAESTYESGGGKIYGGFSYGFSAKEWNYQFGLEPWLFNERKLMVGIDIHKITQIRDETLFPNDEEDFIASAILGRNYRDYYQREGYELSLTQIITPSNKIILKFRDDDYHTLYKMTDWSLFNGDEIKRENLPADDGRMKSIILSYELDSRREKETTMRHFHPMPIPSNKTTNGWKGVVSVEYARSPLGAELNEKFDFTLFGFEITRYNRLSRHQLLDFRLKGGIADNSLPLQYKFYLGGIGSLRGYKFQEFAGGDKMILANVEYKIAPDIKYEIADNVRLGISTNLVIFVDTGYVWEQDETPKMKDLKTNVGIGFQAEEGFRIDIAKPIEEGRKLKLTARLQRAF
jgi:hypothetical protein